MADQKLTALTETTSPATSDDVYIVTTPGGTPASKRCTIANLKTAMSVTDYTGWIPDASTWTYASAQTFTIAGDVTATFIKGLRLKFTQTTVKYAVVLSSSYGAPNTTITIATNTDYVIANAAISATFYSYMNDPQGWPDWFAYAPAMSNETSTQPTLNNGTLTGRYTIKGHTCIGQLKLVWGSSTAAGTGVRLNFSLPVAVSASAPLNTMVGSAKVLDSGTQEYMAMAGLQTTTTIRFYGGSTLAVAAINWSSLFTPATGDEWTAMFTYEI